MYLYVTLEDYIAQWFVHEQGGCTPVHLTRGSIESKILEVFLKPLPSGKKPDIAEPGSLAIIIPSFRYRPPEVYNYLPEHARRYLLKVIRDRFDVQLWTELHHFGKIGKRQDDLIYAWMEKHAITPTEKNWNTIAKRYQRQRNFYRRLKWNAENYKSKKND